MTSLVRTPFKPKFSFFRLSFRYCLSCVLTARMFLLFDVLSAVQNIQFTYLHSTIKYGGQKHAVKSLSFTLIILETLPKDHYTKLNVYLQLELPVLIQMGSARNC